jgi:RNA polymerase sigma factor (sigma-70 family)
LAEVQLDIHKKIIEASKTGDSRAQYKLYQLYSKAMYNVCMRIMNNREDAEDMLQESFTEAFIKLDTFRYEATFGAWLKRIVVNRCINHLKRRNPEISTVDDLAPFDHEEVQFEDNELDVRRIHRAMEKLPEGYRIIFSLYLLEGYDHGEISHIMGITESTSKTQLHRAKAKLKELINAEA